MNRAPHKPLLLLSVLDLFEQGLLSSNLIPYNADLIDTFDLYWRAVITDERRVSSPLLPYFHLRSEGFWQLVPVPGLEKALRTTSQIKTLKQLRELVVGARLDDSLYQAMQAAECRETLRRFLIEQFFAPEIRPALARTSRTVSETFQYSLDLSSQTKRPFRMKEQPEPYSVAPEVRSTAFRKVVVSAYEHRCAVCGLRLVTPEGRTIVEAAHIIPWRHSFNDDPRNGLALCGIHHWAFDQGMLGIDGAYQIDVSPIVERQTPEAALIGSAQGGRILVPSQAALHPARQALRWHYTNIFRSTIPPYLL